MLRNTMWAGLWLPVGLLLTGLLSGCGDVPGPRVTFKPETFQVPPQEVFPLAGSPSCAGKGCHGAPVSDRQDVPAWHSSFTVWQDSDPHARVREVLYGPLAQRMGEILKMNVAEEPRCLACHANPKTALPSVLQTAWARQEWLFGTGCEACHGPAPDWLEPHRSEAWKKQSDAEKQKEYERLHMTYLQSQPVRAEVCVGCHVGAPADPAKGIPARDMNHDFIAAGHPRLMFEYSTYLANLPKHWREKGRNAEPSFQARTWLVGQSVSAKAALDLLAEHRTGSGDSQVWPELSEFDCYACHQPLRNESWQNKKPRPRGVLGNPQPSAWYPGLLPFLSTWAEVKPPVADDAVKYLLALDGPPSSQELATARNKAQADRAALSALTRTLNERPLSFKDCVDLRLALAKHGASRQYADWDEIEQITLGVVAARSAEEAFPEAKEESEKHRNELRDAIQALTKDLAFPGNANSPISFRRAEQLDENRKKQFQTLSKP